MLPHIPQIDKRLAGSLIIPARAEIVTSRFEAAVVHAVVVVLREAVLIHAKRVLENA